MSTARNRWAWSGWKANQGLVGGLLLLIGCSPVGGVKITTVPVDQTLEERVVYRDPGWVSDRIAIIDISGVLLNAYEQGLFSEGEHPVSFTVEKLHAAESDNRVKAVVLRINSPGGSVTASDVLYEEIKRFKEKTRKPVIAHFQDVGASGAYYLACAADEITAERTTVTGSIGVIMQMVDFTGTLGKLGIETDAIKSGPFKDAGSPLRKMQPEERKVFQGLVDGFYRRFVEVVGEGRPKLTPEKILTLADGRVYTAEQALEAGLVDQITTMEGAIAAAKKRAGLSAALGVVYHRPLAWKSTIYAESPGPAGAPTVNLVNINLPNPWTRYPKFMYIWVVDD